MSYFERTEGAEDNLGNNPKFTNLEELVVDTQLTPDEIFMEKEESDLLTATEISEEDVKFDDLPSNWEEDVDAGKYDDYQTERTSNSVEIHPIHTQDRKTPFEIIENGKGKEQFERYWDASKPSEAKNSKPKRPQDQNDSIRFDEAV